MRQETKKKAVVFFIGGAGEKEAYYFMGPNHNMERAKSAFEKMLFQYADSDFYSGWYLDYREVYKHRIAENVMKRIPDKETPVFIVGHSLGGWNGAELSKILSEQGYRVKMLITLDPVGKGFWVYSISRIYFSDPTPKADYWINIKAEPTERDSSDIVADLGERWVLDKEPNINEVFDIHHYDAEEMMTQQLSSGSSAMLYLLEEVHALLKDA